RAATMSGARSSSQLAAAASSTALSNSGPSLRTASGRVVFGVSMAVPCGRRGGGEGHGSGGRRDAPTARDNLWANGGVGGQIGGRIVDARRFVGPFCDAGLGDPLWRPHSALDRLWDSPLTAVRALIRAP